MDSFADNREINAAGLPAADQDAIHGEIMMIARRVLQAMRARNRAILVRFYVDGEDAGRICQDLGIGENEVRNVKSRAKARFRAVVERQIGPGVFFREMNKRAPL